jgi:hypothetical protein
MIRNEVDQRRILIRWIEERRSRRKLLDEEDLYVRNEEEVNNIFFAYQVRQFN